MGRLEISTIAIPFLNKERTLRIYFPEKYDSCKEMRFPVLYMHDGQNLFTDKNAFGGCSWGIKEILEQMESDGETDGIIVVGIDNEGERRFEDYSPWTNEAISQYFDSTVFGGDGDKYADFVANVLKPYVDKTYRTLPQVEHTSIAGSSMGGFISIYIKMKYPELFSKLGAFSSATWFAQPELDAFLDTAAYPKNHKYYIQVGTDETVGNKAPNIEQLFIDGSINLQRKLLQKGVDINDIKLVIGAGEIHSEASWRKYVRDFLTFIK